LSDNVRYAQTSSRRAASRSTTLPALPARRGPTVRPCFSDRRRRRAPSPSAAGSTSSSTTS
jgi:hypothetical protein